MLSAVTRWALLAALLLAPLAARAPAPFTVEIPVLVLDHHGQPVLQLDQDQFRLSDDGLPQRIASFARDPRPVSLAIVVDAGDRDALAQVKRAAQLLVAMVIGEGGEASVYVSGPQPRQLLPFTTDQDKIVQILQHMALAPAAPQGHGQVTEPASQALLDLSHRPPGRARALLIVARHAGQASPAAAGIADAALHQAIAIFRLSPSSPDHTAAVANPDTVQAGGAGPGSQRSAQMPSPAYGRGAVAGADQASVDLTPVAHAAAGVAGGVLAPHAGDYVYASGGLTLAAGDDASFDRQLSSIGADLRSYYYLTFQPNDLVGAGARHWVGVSVVRLGAGGGRLPGALSYRRAYWAPAPPR